MARRHGIVATARRAVDGGRSPNAYVPFVTAELRIHWPPQAAGDEVEAVLDDAIAQARRRLAENPGFKSLDVTVTRVPLGWRLWLLLPGLALVPGVVLGVLATIFWFYFT